MENFKIYTGKYLWKHGYPCTLISETLLSGSTYSVEWFAFTTGHSAYFKAGSIEYTKTAGSSEFDLNTLVSTAAHEASNSIVDALGHAANDSHEALLFTVFCNLSERSEADLIDLHVRGVLPQDITNEIQRLTSSPQIKDFLAELARMKPLVQRELD